MSRCADAFIRLGLAEKEATLYAAMLEAGPKSAQELAELAAVPRTTFYALYEELKKKGLVSETSEGSKRLFVAESPERLGGWFKQSREALEETEKTYLELLPELLALDNGRPGKPRVRFFESIDGLRTIREEIVSLRAPILELYSVDRAVTSLAHKDEQARIAHSAAVKGGRVLLVQFPGITPPFFDRREKDVRVIDGSEAPFSGSFVIVRDRVYLLFAEERGLAIVMEGKTVSQFFTGLFEGLWSKAKEWIPPVGWGM